MSSHRGIGKEDSSYDVKGQTEKREEYTTHLGLENRNLRAK